MAQGDQVTGFLSRLDPGKNRSMEDGSFLPLNVFAIELRHDRSSKVDSRFRLRGPSGDCFVPDIYHVWLVFVV